MNLREVEQEGELKRQKTSKACGKQSSCFLDRLQSECKWREWGGFFFDQAAKAVTEGEEIEPKTLKDAGCQTIDFHYMFQRSRYEAPNKNIFDTDDIVRFYTVLPSMEIAMVVFEHISWHVTRQTLNRSTDLKT